VKLELVAANAGSESTANLTPYQRLQASLGDPKWAQDVALGRRVGLYRFCVCGDLGRGNFSKVKLAIHQLTKGKIAFF
jgi:hypothetical protein